MESLSVDLVSLLQYLLPGFLAAWVFYGFTSFEKPNNFERVIQALIFTLVVQFIVILIKLASNGVGHFYSFGAWTENSDLVVSVIVAVLLGFSFAYFANSDKLHDRIRSLGISKETSYPSEWYGEFSSKITYVVLHLKDGRRLYGWPKEWPSSPVQGHFSIQQASWLVANPSETEGQQAELPLLGVSSILIAAKNVQMVEFMKKTWEENSNEEVV